MLEKKPEVNDSSNIRIVTNVLTAALKLWLRAQVSDISQLEVEIKASDRQLLSGRIPWVSIFASHAVYQGLHFTQVQLIAENIRVNIGSILRGKPLRLLATVPVTGELTLSEEDLNLSLASELLSVALDDVLVQLLPERCPKSKSKIWRKIKLDHRRVILSLSLINEHQSIPLDLWLSTELLSENELLLTANPIKDELAKEEINDGNKSYFSLGSDVSIQELTLVPGKLVCQGKINVNP